MARIAIQRGTRRARPSAPGCSMTRTSGENPIAISALTYTSISASRAAHSAATRIAVPATAATVWSIRRVKSRSEIMKLQKADCRSQIGIDGLQAHAFVNLQSAIPKSAISAEVLCRERRHQIVDLVQLVERREEDDAQEPFVRRQPESGSVHAE